MVDNILLSITFKNLTPFIWNFKERFLKSNYVLFYIFYLENLCECLKEMERVYQVRQIKFFAQSVLSITQIF